MIRTVACRRRALRRAVALTVLLTHASAAAAPLAKPAERQPERVHEVERGDTLTGIARRYGVTISALITSNGLPDDRAIIKIGQRLIIPAPGRGAEGLPAPGPRHRVSVRPPVNLILSVPDFGDRLPLFIWPADGHITSSFGRRRSGWHHGVDIKGDLRGPVLASAGGVVVASGQQRTYGRFVKIEHVNGFMTVYAHNDRNLVSIGDRILPGQTIALIGRTGRATSHHLHFEIRQRGFAYNPLYLLPLPSRYAAVDHGPGDHGANHHEDGDE
jgi:murein DD-endopeptidase MepM/ murein hydrolase activator NlpD